MRIALFSGNYNYLREGANQALNRMVRHVENRGHEVRVYSPVTTTPAFEPAGMLIPVPSVTLPVRGEFQLALGLPRAIRQDVERFDPDVVHVSTPDILDTRAQSFAIHHGIPIVASLHTRFETYLDHYRLSLLRPLLMAHLKRFYRRSSHVLVPTPALRADMVAWRGDERVSIWGRGVDTALFAPERRDMAWRRARGIDDSESVLLFFGRLVIEKGVEDYGAAVAELARRGRPVRPLIVGAGPAEAAMSALPGAVLTGHLDGPDLAAAVASADIMLHPSTTEAFGNVVLEAMASGLAVVAADAPSSAVLLRDGETGLFYRPGDLEGCVAALSALLDDPPGRLLLGEAARRRSLAYCWDAASQAVLDSYALVTGVAGRR